MIVQEISDNVKNTQIKTAGSSASLNLLDGWSPPQKSADAQAIQIRRDANARADELLFTSPVASSITRSLRESVVGSGLKLNYVPSQKLFEKKYGQNNTLYETIKDQVQEKFERWAESKACDYRGQSNFYELTSQAYLDFLSSDCFYSLEYEQGLQIYLIPPAQIQNPRGMRSNIELRDGIRTTRSGRVIGYWLNADQELNSTGPFISVDKSELYHFFRAPKTGASRGIHYLSSAIVLLKLLSDYELSEVKAAQVTSALNFILKNKDGDLFEDTEFEKVEVPTGSLFKVPKGYEFEVNQPSRPNANFNNFVDYVLRLICSVAGAAVESVTLKYDSSYTAARGARIEYLKRINQDRQILELNFCREIFNNWLIRQVELGEIIIPDFENTKNIWLKSNWMGDASELLDPVKEIQASELRVKNLMSTQTEEASRITGNSYNEIVEQQKYEQKLRQGLLFNEEI